MPREPPHTNQRRTSDPPRRSLRHSRSSSAHPSSQTSLAAAAAAAAVPRRRPSAAVLRDSSHSTASGSIFSRSSVSTAPTTHSRAGSTAVKSRSSVQGLSPPHEAAPSTSSSYRDSFDSIVDDPFFRRYNPAFNTGGDGGGGRMAIPATDTRLEEQDEQQSSSSDSQTSDSDDSDDSTTERAALQYAHRHRANRPPPRRESLVAAPSQYWSQTHSTSAMESFNIAVIGATGVGKSSFVQRVLGLPRPPISNASSVRLVVDNVTHMVTLLELDLEHFEVSPDQPIQWPKQINGHIVPRVDAALILYDVTNEESIRELPQTVAVLTKTGLPAVLVACKCERPEDDWEVDADDLANHELFKSCLSSYKISTEKPEVARACLQTILKAAVTHRRDETGETVFRRRAQSAATLEAPESTGRPTSDGGKHSRASSDLSLVRGYPNSPMADSYRGQSSRSPRPGQHQSTTHEGASANPSPWEHRQSHNSMLRNPGIQVDRQGADILLDVDESDAESRRYSDDIPILQRSDEHLDKHAKVAGVAFDELVDRLLAPRLTRADNNFSDVFLCLYRKFAAPGELFSAILTRLDRVRDDKAAHYLSKTATQLRIIEVVAKWVSLYPGDFARQNTTKNLNEFIKHLSTEPIFSIAAQQMRRNLKINVTEDDDTGWANSDDTDDQVASRILSKEFNEVGQDIATLQLDNDADEEPSATTRISLPRQGSGAAGHTRFSSHDEYEKEASQLEPTDQLPMNKFRYHIFMDIPDDDVADELTRIDWIMFSSIRIRDFVRHVSLSTVQKEKCKSLKNVNRMIGHFNHVAQWVANMILLRDKAKHRAQILEKFMNVAAKLRALNNYNGLAAVLAGINGTAIHRLAQTRSLVPADVQKRFARLGILMGTQKSHFAYRLAWENSPLPRIPFIPLHRRDLVSAEEGSKTFVGPKGDRVNWKKFEVLGEVLLPIMRSQGMAYPNLTKHDTARDLILRCRMPTDDEEIYQRSVQVESSSAAPIDPHKKKFPWFAK